MRRFVVLVALAGLGAGCASSPFPEDLTRTVNRSLSLAEIRADPPAHMGEHVILGGDIIKTTPKPGDTEIEILARKLGRALPRSHRGLPRSCHLRPWSTPHRPRHRRRHRGAKRGGRRLRLSGDPRRARQALAHGGPLGRRRLSPRTPRHADPPLPALAGAYFLTVTEEKVAGSM